MFWWSRCSVFFCLMFSLRVAGVAPRFTFPPSDHTVTEGNTAAFTCQTSGAPKPAITWRKGSVPCICITHWATKTHWRDVFVLQDSLNDLITYTESKATWLFCVSVGSQVLASGSVQVPRFTLLQSGGLQIQPVSFQDSGEYMCIASNSEGTINATATLTVWSKMHTR